jgi:para-nitrobenzyl esterase
MDGMGATTVEQMRSLPVEKLIQIPPGPATYLNPNVDGHIIPKDMLATYQAGEQNDVSMVMGNNTHEASQGRPPATLDTYLNSVDNCFPEEAAKQFLDIFRGGSLEQAHASYIRSWDFLLGSWSMRNWAKLQTQTGKHPVYLYRFDQAPPLTPTLGAFHFAEVFYVYGNLDVLQIPWRAEDRTLSEQMQSYWVNFAATGDFNGGGLPHWSSYKGANELEMLLKAPEPHMEPVPDLDVLDKLDRIKAGQRVLPNEKRCY